jgi:hypothetical protein
MEVVEEEKGLTDQSMIREHRHILLASRHHFAFLVTSPGPTSFDWTIQGVFFYSETWENWLF